MGRSIFEHIANRLPMSHKKKLKEVRICLPTCVIHRQDNMNFTDMSGMVTIKDYACRWVQDLKARGFHVYYLSNFSRKVEKECADSLAFIPLMDGGILSYREQLVKPDEAIYRCLLKRYNLQPKECIFLDDTAVNIQAANELGIHGIVFESKEQAMHDIEQIISGNE